MFEIRSPRITLNSDIIYQLQDNGIWVNLFTEREVSEAIIKAHFPEQFQAAMDAYYWSLEECTCWKPEQSCQICKAQAAKIYSKE